MTARGVEGEAIAKRHRPYAAATRRDEPRRPPSHSYRGGRLQARRVGARSAGERRRDARRAKPAGGTVTARCAHDAEPRGATSHLRRRSSVERADRSLDGAPRKKPAHPPTIPPTSICPRADGLDRRGDQRARRHRRPRPGDHSRLAGEERAAARSATEALRGARRRGDGARHDAHAGRGACTCSVCGRPSREERALTAAPGSTRRGLR